MTDLLVELPVDSVLLLGPTGVGKSPLGDLLAVRGFLGRTCRHLDFGSELRSIASGKGLSLYTADELKFIRGVLERGLLLENEHFALAGKIIENFLARTKFKPNDVLVLNGIPRHAGQAHDMSLIAHVHAVIVLECTADAVHCRIVDNIGGDRTDRIDDGKELIEKKLRIFEERTAPLIEYYEKSGSMLYRIPIDGGTTTDEAYNKLLSLAGAYPPVAFIAEPPER